MGQVLHGGATTTAAVRRAIQHGQESLRGLAKRYGINPKTVAKWAGPQHRPRPSHGAQTGPVHRAVGRGRGRRGRLPSAYAAAAGRLPVCPIAEVQTTRGRLYLLVAIDRVTKFAFVELHERATRRIAGDFLRALVKAVPYTVHTVLTDNGTHFTSPGNTCSAAAEIRRAMDCGKLFRAHAFEYACAQLVIEHRLTKPRHPWTNGQVERMNRTLKDATVKRFHYDTHDQLRRHLGDFVNAYTFGRRLKTLKGLTPYEAICKAWTTDHTRFNLDPFHQMPGLST